MLPHILFPLSDFDNKDQIRELAMKKGLTIANKPDSQEICFIPDNDYGKFLREYGNQKVKTGNIVNQKGEVIGKHKGLIYFTIGQRKGLGITWPVPLYVIDLDPKRNEVVVGEDVYKRQGLYINSLIYHIEYEPIGIDQEYRELLEKRVQKEGLQTLYEEAVKIDPKAMEKISNRDQKRILRAVSYTHLGSDEFLAAHYKNGFVENGRELIDCNDLRLKNVYEDYGNQMFGDALYETTYHTNGVVAWYKAYVSYCTEPKTFINRGGNYENKYTAASLFGSFYHIGEANELTGFRPVVVI